MGQLQDDELDIDRRIVGEIAELTPEWWSSAVLDVRYEDDGDVQRYAHSIGSPDGYKDIVEPSDVLFGATYELGQLFRRYGKHWREVKYEIRQQASGEWAYSVSFKYDNAAE